MPNTPFILLVNPWITDFAAFDLWSKPLGLLMLGALLREGGCRVGFLDCLDRYDPDTNRREDTVLPPDFQRYGTGKYPKTPIATPSAVEDIPRRYYRYGIHPDSMRKRLEEFPKPDLVWVTCAMTYWYPGAQECIRVVREVHPDVEIWLGGVYARLCAGHAREHSGADRVVSCSHTGLPEKLGFELKNKPAWQSLQAAPSPALDLAGKLTYLPLLTGLGCPLDCPYCATSSLQSRRENRLPQDVLGDIRHWNTEHGIEDFAFYDDALLADAERTIKPVLQGVCLEGLSVRFHTPNAIHVHLLTKEMCRLLYECGFTTLRLGLETTQAERQRELGGKVDTEQFLEAVENLRAAGFSGSQIGVYLMCGLPGQIPEDVDASVRMVSQAGAQPHLSEYSPIPGTRTFEELPADLKVTLQAEPLTHNNSYFACRRPDFSYDDLVALKRTTRLARRTDHVV